MKKKLFVLLLAVTLVSPALAWACDCRPNEAPSPTAACAPLLNRTAHNPCCSSENVAQESCGTQRVETPSIILFAKRVGQILADTLSPGLLQPPHGIISSLTPGLSSFSAGPPLYLAHQILRL